MKTSAPSLGRRVTTQLGYSLIEVCFAVGLLSLLSAGVIAAHSQVLGLLRTAKDDVSASQALQQRVEQMRIANWTQITDATYMSNSLKSLPSPSLSGLTSPTETITIAPYPARTGVTPIKITRTGTTVTINSTNSALIDERMIKVDIRLGWVGFPKQRARARGTTILIAQGGITK